jgi:hypothetical protein
MGQRGLSDSAGAALLVETIKRLPVHAGRGVESGCHLCGAVTQVIKNN